MAPGRRKRNAVSSLRHLHLPAIGPLLRCRSELHRVVGRIAGARRILNRHRHTVNELVRFGLLGSEGVAYWSNWIAWASAFIAPWSRLCCKTRLVSMRSKLDVERKTVLQRANMRIKKTSTTVRE